MVSIEQINDYYTKNNKKLIELTNAYKNKYKQYSIDTLTYINESYLHIHKLKDEITYKQIESYIVTFIKNNIIWNDSPIKRKEVIKEKNELTDIEDLNEHNEEKELKLQAIEEVYTNENDQIKKIIHEVYFTKNKTSCRLMADHFGIQKNQANELINQLKIDINEKFKTKKRLSQ